MAVAIPFVMMAGAVISAVGAVQAGKAQSAAASYNAQQNESDAKAVLDQSLFDAGRFRVQANKHEGSMIAQLGVTGGAEGTESILADSASNARLDEELIKYEGRVRAIGFYNSATLDRFRAKTAVDQSYLKGAAALLSGAGQAGATSVMSTSRLRMSPARAGNTGSTNFFDEF